MVMVKKLTKIMMKANLGVGELISKKEPMKLMKMMKELYRSNSKKSKKLMRSTKRTMIPCKQTRRKNKLPAKNVSLRELFKDLRDLKNKKRN